MVAVCVKASTFGCGRSDRLVTALSGRVDLGARQVLWGKLGLWGLEDLCLDGLFCVLWVLLGGVT